MEGMGRMDTKSIFDTHLGGDTYNTGQLRRSTLTSLRWMAVIGQLLALVVVYFALGIELPLIACLAVISFSAWVNVMLVYLLPLDRRISNKEVGAQLFFDVLQLSILLYLTGGMQNPFALLLLAPVVVAAKTLNQTVFAFITIIVALSSLLLLFYHMPLPWFGHEIFTTPKIYQYGQWVALQVGMLFTSVYTWRATAQTKRITEALAATDAILSHEKKLSALGGLAAAAAHKLGTPLSTIQLVAKEIDNMAEPGSELAEDAALLRSQAKHCHEILQELAQRGDQGDALHDRLSFADLIQEITDPFVGLGKLITTDITHPDPQTAMPILRRSPEFVYGLTNIVENAADFAHSEVKVLGTWSDNKISIDVIDDGPGFASSVLAKVGEPYISFRPNNQHSAGGMGLGVFIATMLIKRVGGSIKFSNLGAGDIDTDTGETTTGAKVQMQWPVERHVD